MAEPVKVTLTAVDQVTPALKSIQASAEGVSRALGSMGQLIGIAGIGALFDEAVTKANDAQRNTALLAVTLSNIGPTALAQLPAITTFLDTLSIHSTLTRETLGKDFQEIAAKVGSVSGAETILQVANDAAAGGFGSMERSIRAATLAYEGNITGLKRMGVQVKEGETGIQALEDRYHGLGAAAVTPLDSIKKATDLLLISIGNLVIKNNEWNSSTNGVVTGIVKLTNWLNGPARQGLYDFLNAIDFSIKSTIAVIWEIPAELEKIGGRILQVDAWILGEINKLLNKVGIHTFDATTAQFKAAADGIVASANEHIQSITNRMQKSIDEAKLSVQETATASDTGTGGPLGDVGKLPPPKKEKKEKEPELTTTADIIELQKVRLSLDNEHADALSKLSLLQAALLQDAQDETLADKERVEAARNYASITAAINEDAVKRAKLEDATHEGLDADVKLQQDLLQLGDKHDEALQQLLGYQQLYLNIAEDITQDEKTRLAAATKYLDITKTITEEQRRQDEADKKAAADALKGQLESYKGGITAGGDSKTAALKDLMTLRQQYIKILKDENSTTDEVAAAQEALDKVTTAGGKTLRDYVGNLTILQRTQVEITKTLDQGLNRALAVSMNIMLQSGKSAKEKAQAEKKAIGDIASSQGKSFMLEGLAKIAQSIFPPNPLGLLAGGEELAAGVALEAFGGTLGGSGGGGGGGGGGGAGGSSGASRDVNAGGLSGGGRGNVQINLMGSGVFNMHDPATRYAFQDAMNTLAGQNVPVNFPGS